jgi:type IV secretory pathway TrbD component
MTKSMKNENAGSSDESIMQMMAKVSRPLLIAIFILSTCLAFGVHDFLETNLGVSRWIPFGLLVVGVTAVFTPLFVNAIREDRMPVTD